jgi:tetratricopeptide (TPR) repeat protein
MTSRAQGPVGFALAVCLLGGSACASRTRVSLPTDATARPAQSTVRPEPDTNGRVRSPDQAPVDGLEAAMRKIQHVSAHARPKHVSGPTIESTNPRLAAALLTLATVPGGASHRLVAAEYARVGVIDAAYDHYRRAVLLDPRDAAAHDGLARCWRDWGLPEAGVGDAQRAVYFAPRSAEAHNTLGTLLQAAGLRAHARKAYERSLSLDPRAAYALNNLCYVALLDNRTQEAIGYCQQAIAIDGELGAARRNLALVHAASGHVDLAWNELQRADAPPVASYNLGIINLGRREPREALAAFTSACRANSVEACRRATQLRLQLAHTEDEQQ